jgi:hypothetical protein
MRSYQRIASHADMQLLLLLLLPVLLLLLRLLLLLQLVHCDDGHRVSSYHSGHIPLPLYW